MQMVKQGYRPVYRPRSFSFEQTGDVFDQCGFARTIFAHQSKDTARRHRERDIVEGNLGSEGASQIGNLDNGPGRNWRWGLHVECEHLGRTTGHWQACRHEGGVPIYLERGCVADQPQCCDWLFEHSRAPGFSNQDTSEMIQHEPSPGAAESFVRRKISESIAPDITVSSSKRATGAGPNPTSPATPLTSTRRLPGGTFSPMAGTDTFSKSRTKTKTAFREKTV